MARTKRARRDIPPNVHCVRSRGNDYYYFQPSRNWKGEKTRVKLQGAPMNRDGTPNSEWWAAYRKCMGEPAKLARSGTFAALIEAYKASPEWHALSTTTQSDWSRYLRSIESIWGSLNVIGLEAKHVFSLRDKYKETPAAANNLLRCLSSLMSWSIPRGWRDSNPCTHVKKLKGGKGYSPWGTQDIDLFKTHARVELWNAAALALYSGQRLGDVLKMRWDDIDQGLIGVTQNKTARKLLIPMHASLRELLDGLPRKSVTILTSSRGTPWTVMGFKASWGSELNRPEMALLRQKDRVFHGLRKSAVVFLLEAGCTDAEVASITGQSRQMIEHYSREVNQKKLAARAILKWESADK